MGQDWDGSGLGWVWTGMGLDWDGVGLGWVRFGMGQDWDGWLNLPAAHKH